MFGVAQKADNVHQITGLYINTVCCVFQLDDNDSTSHTASQHQQILSDGDSIPRIRTPTANVVTSYVSYQHRLQQILTYLLPTVNQRFHGIHFDQM